MTEYGQGAGSGPWYPEDPLHGNQGWNGSQQQAQPGDWDASHIDQSGVNEYAWGQQPYPNPEYPQQYDSDWSEWGAYPQGGYGQPYDQPYDQPYGVVDGGAGVHGGQFTDPFGTRPPVDPYTAPPGDPYGGRPDVRYDTGAGEPHGAAGDGTPDVPHGDPYAAHQPWDPYGSPPAAPGQYGTGEQPVPPDPHAVHQSTGVPGVAGPQNAEPEYDPVPEHNAGTETDSPTPSTGRRGRGRRRRGATKRRSGAALLIASLVLCGGVGVAGWFGFQFYQSHFGAPPDYAGEGHGEVQVEIPEGSSISDMGRILERAGVVRSQGSFVAAAKANEEARGIHAGIYVLRREMSAEAAVELMLDPASRSGLIVPEGRRAKQVYALIDRKLGEKKGTTRKVAKTADLGLPSWAKGNPEGFLFPAKYSVGKETTPKELLRAMVERAETEYRKMDLESKAEKVGHTAREVVIIASLIQAEARAEEDFGKVSRVIYNRLEVGKKLQFDSTINYAKGESELETSVEDTRFKSPYNTYLHPGLPPGPIDNPGRHALNAALNPTKGDWLYFVTVKPGDTRFTDSYEEHLENVEDFNRYQREHDEEDG